MATIPIPNQVNKFTGLETDFGTTIASALWVKAAQIAQYINASYPIGMVLFFEGSQDNVPAQPDPRFWAFLDGHTVSNAASPLNGVTLPDFRNKFFRHVGSGEVALSVAGADTHDLNHNHGGQTGFGSDWDSIRLDDGEERGQAIGSHRHTIASAMSDVTTIPAYHEVQCYIRIA
jgi:hypothetical protein